MTMQAITPGITPAGKRYVARLKAQGKTPQVMKPGPDSIIKPNTKYKIKAPVEKKGFLAKITSGLGKIWGWAKTHKKISIPIAIVLGILGISKIAGKSKAKKAEGLDAQA